ncbi:MAG: hypothetical protein M3353_07575, partial [Actinomycetota bacterium]|nr:hypothetical protein [Actinomycetota bacterium]
RTPVTILRGHLELLDESDPDDVRATRALLLDEIDRMSRFVDDLIVLAKSGRPRLRAAGAGRRRRADRAGAGQGGRHRCPRLAA